MIEELRSAPPEFAASELVRLASFRIKNDPDWQRELLQEAFALASQAQQPFKRPMPPTEITGAASFAKTVAELGMDRLSLQCSVIQVLLEVDPAQALEFLREIELNLPVTRCEEAAAPNVDAFYQMLLAVTKRCFNLKQQEKGEDIAFLEEYLRQVNHPSQVAPAARLVRFYGTTPERLERLLTTFLAALDEVRQDDRAFTVGNNLPSAAELQTLGIFCTQYSKRGEEVFTRIRRYLVEHLNGPRCADNVLTSTGKPMPLPHAISEFNQLIAFDGYKIEEITETEIKPVTIGGRAESSRLWKTAAATRLKLRFYETVIGWQLSRPKEADAATLPSIQRPLPTAPERLQALQDFFVELSEWETEENVSATDFYSQKLLLYGEAFRWVPPSPLLKQVLGDYVNLLSSSRSQFSSFPAWYPHFKSLLSGYTMAGIQGTTEAAREALQNSDDPFIQLFLRLSKAPVEK